MKKAIVTIRDGKKWLVLPTVPMASVIFLQYIAALNEKYHQPTIFQVVHEKTVAIHFPFLPPYEFELCRNHINNQLTED